MRKTLMILLFLFLAIPSMAQKNNQIKYVLPDTVETFLDSCIKKQEGGKTWIYFLLKKDTLYSITIGKYSTKEKKNILQWVKQTNRYILINKVSYPLIFDYDLRFGAIDDNIGEFGSRDDNVKRVNLILHGTTIYFKSDGSVVQSEEW